EACGLLVYQIKVTQGDNGIDFIVTYKEKLILIQCKNIETSISVQTVQSFESAISRFSSDSLGIIFVKIIKDFYESDDDNYIELVDYKADSFNINSLLGENVSIINDLDSLYQSKDNSSYDTIITVDIGSNKQQIFAHSNILRARSTYFQNALSKNWAKKENQFFVLSQPYISALIFNIILKYLYCGMIELNDLDIDTILKLLVAVDELSIEELIDFIQDCLISSDFLETHSYKILNFIDTKSMFTKLKKSIFKTICKKPKVLFDHDEFINLKKDLLKLVIQHDDLDMKENEIWKYLIKWSKNHSEESLLELINYIRFYQFIPNEFMNEVWNHKNLLSEDLLKDIVHYFIDLKQEPKYDTSFIIWGNFTIKSDLIKREIALILTKLIDKTKDDASKGFKYKFTSLYNSYSDGWTPQSFHSKCNNQGPTIVITKIKNTTLLMGGYNPLDWNGNSQYKKTADSFLFIIDYKKISNCFTTYIKLDHIDQAIYCDNDCNPTFGEYDFFISQQKSLKYLPKFYNKIVNNCTYSLDSYEVFQISKIG
ncbi:17935_t:CDS:2, partial [Cetraspora pellucida]